jgi:hypothetical protein
MSIDTIGSINTALHTDPRTVPQRQHPAPEKAVSTSAGKAGGVKNVTKTNDPPFFPLCVTQSMFKAER